MEFASPDEAALDILQELENGGPLMICERLTIDRQRRLGAIGVSAERRLAVRASFVAFLEEGGA